MLRLLVPLALIVAAATAWAGVALNSGGDEWQPPAMNMQEQITISDGYPVEGDSTLAPPMELLPAGPVDVLLPPKVTD